MDNTEGGQHINANIYVLTNLFLSLEILGNLTVYLKPDDIRYGCHHGPASEVRTESVRIKQELIYITLGRVIKDNVHCSKDIQERIPIVNDGATWKH